MKLRIAVCDDDTYAQSMVAGAIQAVLLDRGYQTEVERFTSAEALLQAMETAQYNITAMEVRLPCMDGIEAGRQMRQRGHKTQLIYVSDWEERVFEALHNHPLGFVRKSCFLKDLLMVMDLYRQCPAQAGGTRLELPTRRDVVTLDVSQIRYVEGCRNYQLVYTREHSGPVEVKTTMDRIEAMLGDFGFLRVHRGYLVNSRDIFQVTYNAVQLRDGLRLPVGQSKARQVRQQFLELSKV